MAAHALPASGSAAGRTTPEQSARICTLLLQRCICPIGRASNFTSRIDLDHTNYHSNSSQGAIYDCTIEVAAVWISMPRGWHRPSPVQTDDVRDECRWCCRDHVVTTWQCLAQQDDRGCQARDSLTTRFC